MLRKRGLNLTPAYRSMKRETRLIATAILAYPSQTFIFNYSSVGLACFFIFEQLYIHSQLDNLSEDERRALRGSKFAPLPAHPTNKVTAEPRVPHPGGPVATNKAAALAKFLQRKLETSSGSLDPVLVEAAVENAKATLHGISSSAVKVRHVDTFSDSDEKVDAEGPAEGNVVQATGNKRKRKKKKKGKVGKQAAKAGNTTGKGPLKKLKKDL